MMQDDDEDDNDSYNKDFDSNEIEETTKE